MAENPKILVSIVMTSYNRAGYIAQAINSILAQERSFLIEIIIGDDYSTDGSRELLEKFRMQNPGIVVLNFQEKNRGFGPNWASTLKLARGQYVAFLDDDDFWCDNHRLEEMVSYMEANIDCGLIYTNRYVWDVDTNNRWVANQFIPDNVNQKEYIFSSGFPILFSSTMIRKSLLDKYVVLDDYISKDFPIQDWPTAMQLADHCEFHYFSNPSVVYRYYSGSMSKPKEYVQLLGKYAKEKIMYKYVCSRCGISFDEVGWDRYVSGLCLSLAYSRHDFTHAKRFAEKVGKRNVKTICARSRVLFYIFCYLKSFKEILRHKK